MLQNLSLRFDPVEDRLVLRLVLKGADGAPDEHWLHLTRRVCVAWRQDLQAMVDLSAQAPARLDAAAKAAVSNAHHQALSSQAVVRTEKVSADLVPNAPPVLVTKIVCGRRKGDGRWVIRFDRRDQPSLNLILSAQTLHGLVDAVSRRLKTAGWALPVLPTETAKDSAAPTPGARLH